MSDYSTETEELRRMLDRRSVEWRDEHNEFDYITAWHANGIYANFSEDKGLCEPNLLAVYYEDINPEQVVAATIGRGTCHDVGEYPAFRCSECGGWTFVQTGNCSALIDTGGNVFESPKYCPLCGRKVVAK